MSKKAAKSQARFMEKRAEGQRLGTMIMELKRIRDACDPGAVTEVTIERSNKDAFQKLKMQLNVELRNLRSSTERLAEIRSEHLGETQRSAAEIKQLNENEQSLRDCMALWEQLKEQFVKDTKKGKKDEATLADRQKHCKILLEEIKSLHASNARVRQNKSSLEMSLEKRKTEAKNKRKEAREARRARRNSRNNNGDVSQSGFEAPPVSAQEQAFLDQVETNFNEQDEMLDEIGRGLEELKAISLDMNKHLKLQEQMIADVDEKMDTVNREMKTANERLQDIFEESGGMSRWCPMLICLILLLAMIGYIVNSL